jgi:hypothetical protein
MKLTENLSGSRRRVHKAPAGQDMFVDLGPVIPATQQEVRQASRFVASCALGGADARMLLDALDLLRPLTAAAEESP